MNAVMLTAKRQATFPASLCRELGVGPGDRVVVERRVVDGRPAWILRGRALDWSWFGAARRYGQRKSHRWLDVKRAVERAWAGDSRP